MRSLEENFRLVTVMIVILAVLTLIIVLFEDHKLKAMNAQTVHLALVAVVGETGSTPLGGSACH